MKIKIYSQPIEGIRFWIGRLSILVEPPIKTSFKFGYYFIDHGGRLTPISDFWMRLQFPIKIFWGEIFKESCIDDDDDDFYDEEESIDEEEY